MIIFDKFTTNTLNIVDNKSTAVNTPFIKNIIPPDLQKGDGILSKLAVQNLLNFLKTQPNNSFIYEKISIDLPTRDKKNEYSVTITHNFNKNRFENYKNKLITLNIDSPKTIKNFYSIDENAIEEYYSSDLKPAPPSIDWRIYTDYLLSNFLVKEKNNPNNISKLPEYVKISIPKIPNLDKNKENLFFNMNKFLFSSMKDSSIYGFKNIFFLYEYVFNNYIKAPIENNKIIPNTRNYNDIFNLQNLTSIPPQNYYISPNPILSQAFDDFIPDVRLTLDSILSSNITEKQIIEDISLSKQTTFIPIFYKITKSRQRTNKLEVLQNIYIPFMYNEPLEYIDNQVLPFENYKYNITLVGMSIPYFIQSDGEKISNFSVFPKILDIPYFEGFAEQEDTFPVIPEASIHPIFNNPNRIKIFLNSRASYEKPIFFSKNEQKNMTSDPVFFNNSKFQEYFIYRINEKPSSYSSFSFINPKKIKSDRNAFYDSLETNKIYYYIFRAYDGNRYSNPSEVYQVEIRDINGAIVPIIQTYSFDTPEATKIGLFDDSYHFKQRISIKPSYYQLNLKEIKKTDDTYKNSEFVFDRSNFANLESIFQGNENSPKYKIRLISKLSGKMLDINIDYRYQIKNNLKK